MKAKRNQKWLRGAKTASLREFSLLNEGGKFLDTKTFPSLVFYILNAGVARPGELTCQNFFFKGALTMPPPSYGLAFCLLELT